MIIKIKQLSVAAALLYLGDRTYVGLSINTLNYSSSKYAKEKSF